MGDRHKDLRVLPRSVLTLLRHGQHEELLSCLFLTETERSCSGEGSASRVGRAVLDLAGDVEPDVRHTLWRFG